MLYYVCCRWVMQKKIEEIFGGIPSLMVLFQEYERELVRAELGIHKKGVSAEQVRARNMALMDVAQSITAGELKLLFYLRNTDGINIEKLLKDIKKVYRAQCAFYNAVDNGARRDIMQLASAKSMQ